MTKTITISLAGLALLGLTGCETWSAPTAEEMGLGDCVPAGPHDVAPPGSWICEGEDTHERVQPRHRVED